MSRMKKYKFIKQKVKKILFLKVLFQLKESYDKKNY